MGQSHIYNIDLLQKYYKTTLVSGGIILNGGGGGGAYGITDVHIDDDNQERRDVDIWNGCDDEDTSARDVRRSSSLLSMRSLQSFQNIESDMDSNQVDEVEIVYENPLEHVDNRRVEADSESEDEDVEFDSGEGLPNPEDDAGEDDAGGLSHCRRSPVVDPLPLRSRPSFVLC